VSIPRVRSSCGWRSTEVMASAVAAMTICTLDEPPGGAEFTKRRGTSAQGAIRGAHCAEWGRANHAAGYASLTRPRGLAGILLREHRASALDVESAEDGGLPEVWTGNGSPGWATGRRMPCLSA
jgi:hypothetical protein